ncbi:AMP-binding protein, partial [Magnetospirillum fulvum]
MTQVIPPALACLPGPRDPSLLRDERLDEIFAATVARTPAARAVTFGDTSLDYSELAARAERIAGVLAARGIGPGAFVGLWMSRSIDLHAALLGILRSGAAYIPFDADAPSDRIAECLADCRAAAILVDADTAGRIAQPLPAPVLDVAPLLNAAPAEPAPAPRDRGATSDSPAYLIYTSGSTGRPKAVVVPHRAICHYLRAANSLYGIESSDVVFQGASVAFDLSLEEIFIPYLVGARLWIAGPRTLAETEQLPDLLGEAGITVLDTVPTLLSLLSRDVPSLRLIILG